MHDLWNPWHGCVRTVICIILIGSETRMDRKSIKPYLVSTIFCQKTERDSFRWKENSSRGMHDLWFLSGRGRSMSQRSLGYHPGKKWCHFLSSDQKATACQEMSSIWLGWRMENVFFHVRCENPKRVDERIPILKSLPFAHKGIMCASLIGTIDLKNHLQMDRLNRSSAVEKTTMRKDHASIRGCDLFEQCRSSDVTFFFFFFETGNVLVKDGI